MGDLERLKEELRRAREEGTFVLAFSETLAKIRKARPFFAQDEEIADAGLEMAGVLAVVQPENEPFLRELLADKNVPSGAKIKSYLALRTYFFEPDRAERALGLSVIYLHHPDPVLRDFSIRSFLQTITEMQMGGAIRFLTGRPQAKTALAESLDRLERENWLEASELKDFLDLNA